MLEILNKTEFYKDVDFVFQWNLNHIFTYEYNNTENLLKILNQSINFNLKTFN